VTAGDKKRRKDNATQRGYADGAEAPTAPGGEQTDPGGEQTAVSLPPFVEVELVYERGRVGMQSDQWRLLEIWTRNRIYIVDTHMKCIEVCDRKSGTPDPDHSLLGATLAGGQRRNADAMEMTHPFPRPDTEAVFEYPLPRKGYVSTSTVTRVVLRLRVLTVPHDHVRPTWDHLSGAWKIPP